MLALGLAFLVKKSFSQSTTVTIDTFAGPINPSAGTVDGIGTNALFDVIHGIAIAASNEYSLIADPNNQKIRKIITSSVEVSTFVGSLQKQSGTANGIGTNALFFRPTSVCLSSNSLFAFIADHDNHLIRQVIITTATVSTLAGGGPASTFDGLGLNSRFLGPRGVCISKADAYLLVAEDSVT
jgi:hypothetical protein